MADIDIKKVIIPKDSLPSINADEGKYVVRYRIVSEDRNRISHWSPQYFISPIALEQGQFYTINIVTTSTFVTATWKRSVDDPEADTELYNQIFDVYVAWGNSPGTVGNIEYFATVNGNYVVIPRPAGKTQVKLFIQTLTYPKKRLESVTVVESNVVAMV
jgi:hypothetical protein